jgi:hypothetical protein
LLAVVIGVAAGSAGAARKPATLRITSHDPLVVRGAHFRASERVRVTANVGLTVQRRVVAGARGGFTVTFDQVPVDRCTGGFVRAVGSSGTRAAVKLPQLLCPPPL